MPDHEDTLGGETFSGEEQQDPAEQSLGEGETLDGDAKADPAEQSLGDGSTLGGGDTSSLSDTSEVAGDHLAAGLPVIDLGERFEIKGELGQGGMGTVLLARDKSLGRQVAIKRILETKNRTPAAINRFITEAKSIAAVNHHNIVQIHEFGQDADGPLIVFEYVSGGSLLDRLKKGKLDPEETIRITCQLCDALTFAHDKGIIHRDIKPANVLITEDGVPKLTDFGLAKQQNTDHGQTAVGDIMGTPDYMPPEQKRDSSSVDERSDLWSLAAVCYQMLTGKTPKVIRERDIPVNMRDPLMQALEEDPADRFQSALEMREAILQAHSGKMDTSRTLGEGECPQCATPNPSGNKYCDECGASLQVKCLNCESDISIWNKACRECGAQQDPLVQDALNALQTKHDEAEAFLNELKFEDALKSASVIGEQNDLRLQQFASWQEEFSQRLVDTRKAEHERLEELLEEAKTHEENYDYEAARGSLSKVDKRLEDYEFENLGSAKSIRARITAILARIKKLSTANETVKEQAVAFLEEFEFDKAIEAAREIETDNFPHLKEYAAWFDEFGEEVQSKRNAAYKQLEEQLSQALEHEENFDYEAGLETLGQVAPSLKRTTIGGGEDVAAELTERLTAKQTRFKELEEDVDTRVAKQEMSGLLRIVDELLTLKPDHPNAQKLKEQLENRTADLLEARDVAVKQAKQQLGEQQYAEAVATLKTVSEEVSHAQLEELKTKASGLLKQLNALRERIHTAVSGNEFKGLLPVVLECLTLKADQDELVKLKQDLIDHEEQMDARNQQIISQARTHMQQLQFDEAVQVLDTIAQEYQTSTTLGLSQQAHQLSEQRQGVLSAVPAALSNKNYQVAIKSISQYLGKIANAGIQDPHLEQIRDEAKGKASAAIRNKKFIKAVIPTTACVVVVLITGVVVKMILNVKAVETANRHGDWKTVLELDPDNRVGLQLKAIEEMAAANKAAAEKAATDKAAADKAVAEKAAADKAAKITAALAQGDWNTVLDLDPSNRVGLDMRAAAEKVATVILARAPITNTIGITLKEIPAGTFTMGLREYEVLGRDGNIMQLGSKDSPSVNQHTQHTVTISKAFYMQTTEVTQGQWKEVMGTEPWKDQEFKTPEGGDLGFGGAMGGLLTQQKRIPIYIKEGESYPATYVSWNDAVAFCKTLSKKEDKKYRLPTEAEWEYACRAGTKTAWSFGNNENKLVDYAWYEENAYSRNGQQYAHQVGLKNPNAFGLYDMHGNVFEWCHDYYGEDYYIQSPKNDPTGPASGVKRVIRGGSWFDHGGVSRSADRYKDVADHHVSINGFRVVRELD